MFKKSFSKSKRTRRVYRRKSHRVPKMMKKVNRKLANLGLTRPQMRHSLIHAVAPAAVLSTISGKSYDFLFNPLTLGAAPDEDTGGGALTLKYTAKYLRMSSLFYNATATTQGIRILIVEDLEPASAPLVLTGPVTNFNRCILQYSSFNSFVATYVPRTFKVLYDKSYFLTGSTNYQDHKHIKIHVPLHNAIVSNTFDVGAPTMSPQNRSYQMFLISSSAATINYYDLHCDMGFISKA